jgi:tRNA(Ile)-lysidine synthase
MKTYYLESFDGKLIKELKREPVYVTFNSLQYGKTSDFELRETGKTIESVQLNEADFPIVIRNVKAGDKIEMRFGKKSLSRFFIDRKINRIQRKRWLVMENRDGRVIFVPGLGCDTKQFSVKANVFMIQ